MQKIRQYNDDFAKRYLADRPWEKSGRLWYNPIAINQYYLQSSPLIRKFADLHRQSGASESEIRAAMLILARLSVLVSLLTVGTAVYVVWRVARWVLVKEKKEGLGFDARKTSTFD